jgi:hypothetical protein
MSMELHSGDRHLWQSHSHWDMHRPLKSSRESCLPYLLLSRLSLTVLLILGICPLLRVSRLTLMLARMGRLWTISCGLLNGTIATLTTWSNHIASYIIWHQYSRKLLQHMHHRCFARSICISSKRRPIISSNTGRSNHLTLLFNVAFSISSSQQTQKGYDGEIYCGGIDVVCMRELLGISGPQDIAELGERWVGFQTAEAWPTGSRIRYQDVDEAVGFLDGINDTSEVVLEGYVSLEGNYLAMLLNICCQ